MNNPQVPGSYVNVFLTDEEIATEFYLVEDGWAQPGDDVALGGYVPEDGENSSIDISINGETSDCFISWDEIPISIRDRMR